GKDEKADRHRTAYKGTLGRVLEGDRDGSASEVERYSTEKQRRQRETPERKGRRSGVLLFHDFKRPKRLKRTSSRTLRPWIYGRGRRRYGLPSALALPCRKRKESPSGELRGASSRFLPRKTRRGRRFLLRFDGALRRPSSSKAS